MVAIWSPEAKIVAERRLWLAVLRAQAELGVEVPATAIADYERALEERGLPLVSQAGRNLFRRQEAQDFVALIRALADPSDTLALGALLRGPLVGLTNHELLDITWSLAPDGTEDRPPAPRLTQTYGLFLLP